MAAAAAAAAAAVAAARPMPVKLMTTKWDKPHVRFNDFFQDYRMHCHTNNVAEEHRAGVLYDALPASARNTVRNAAMKLPVDILNATVDQIKQWLTTLPDTADKSQCALRFQLETMKVNWAKFSKFLDEWNAVLERCLEFDPPIDPLTQCYFFYRVLTCSRLRTLLATDQNNQQWRDVTSMQSAAHCGNGGSAIRGLH
jgi:hypothetical protein